jgi:hypothetical protein
MGWNWKVDSNAIMAALMRRNGQTFGGEHGVTFMPDYMNCVVRHFGMVKMKSGVLVSAQHFYKTEAWQDDYARKLVANLNKQLHHDGVWAVMWTNPTEFGMPTELRIAFQDKDGDPQFVIEVERTLTDLMVHGPDSHMENCERAYQQWVRWQKEMEISEKQKIKWGQGQEQINPLDQPLI